MRLRQFRLLIVGEPAESAADALFDRADDACVEVLPPSYAPPGAAGSSPAEGRAPRAFDGLPGGLAPADPGGRVAWVAFDRVAPTLIDAVVSGVRDLDGAGLAVAAAVADDPIVTLETIGERLERPAGVVRSWDLPEPVHPHPRRPVYDWTEVAQRLAARRGYAPLDDEATMEAVTLTLRVRELRPRLERMAPLRALLC
ncbi:hypothetical protein [Dactylosporangium sp. NPDC051484]|uniref:hypothetical protein n=1 Tax=Dactylosporangium sp. NPDC051484 TaxID=3154942 RepID=UPI003450A85A